MDVRWTGGPPRDDRTQDVEPTPDDLGPLPQSDPAHVLSRHSRDRFRSVVQGNLFIVREEMDPDYGKDLSVEVVVGKSVTNFRFQAQLKSMEKSAPNADGSISYPVEITNVCYLLNCPKAMYVLYTADDEMLRYQWVDVFLQKLESENPSWKSQQTVTIRFDRILDAAALDSIHEEARRCGTLARDVGQCLGRVGMTGPASIRVEVGGLQVQDLTQVAAFVDRHGMDLVAGGHARALVTKAEEIPPELLKASKAALAIAWAELLCGRPLAARARLGAGRHRSETGQDSAICYRSGRKIVGMIDRKICWRLRHRSASDPVVVQVRPLPRAEGTSAVRIQSRTGRR